MATLQELTVVIGADTGGLDEIDQAAEKATSGFDKVQDSGRRLTDVGKGLTAGVTTPIVGLGTAVVTTAASFESSMNGVRAVTGATGQDLDDLTGLAREMGSTTQFSASEAAAGMEFLGMAGWDTTEIMSGLPDVLNLAAAGGMELANAADIASNIMSGFGIEASEAARVSDVLADASASANTSVEQLGGGFTYVGPVASSAGMSLEETAATLGVLADAGIQGEQGGTALRGALSQLLNPTAQVQGVMDDLGVSIQDADGAMRPFPDIMRDLEGAGADTSEMMQIFGQEAGPAMLALLERGADDVAAFTEQLEGSEGAAQEMADIRMEGLSGQLKALQSAAEGLMLELGDTGLLNVVTTVVEKFTEWTQKLNDTSPRLLQIAVVVAAVLAALGPLLIVVGMTITAIGQIGGALKVVAGAFRIAAGAKMLFSAALWASPITWIVLGIMALIAVIVLCIVYWDEISAAVGRAWDWIVSKVEGATALVSALVSLLVAWVLDTINGWGASLSSLVSGIWDSVTGFFASARDTAVSVVSGMVSNVLGFIAGLAALPGMVGSYFAGMVSTAAGQISSLISQAAQIPGRIMSAVGNLGSLLVGAGRNVIQGLISGITSMIGRVGSAMSNVASTIRGYLPFSPAEVGPMSGSGAPEVSGARIADQLGEGIMSELTRIDRAADALMSPLDDRVAAMQGAASRIPSNVNAAASRVEGQEQRVVIDVTGTDGEMKKLIRKMVRTDGRGDVQTAFGR
ncbi:phage tail tape measure protein [Nocardiopsis salina]|uniref:phage tail tape measure protein n=1 Tax=Nocardiopsis salina TaxID=245836 RepID=UPI00034BD44D|nr:phage tail tape measure protein [Nocardiopsis salina]